VQPSSAAQHPAPRRPTRCRPAQRRSAAAARMLGGKASGAPRASGGEPAASVRAVSGSGELPVGYGLLNVA
jgi:hypothetical protein